MMCGQYDEPTGYAEPAPKGGPVWAWCPTCKSWIGSTPPVLPPYWGNDKSAGMHRNGTGHTVKVVRFDQLDIR